MHPVTVFIPSQMRDLTGGQDRVDIEAKSVREVIHELEERFPGFAERLISGDRLSPGMAVSIDSEISNRGLNAVVPAGAEVHFVPAIGGG